jgi:Dyp-type peroxidase family
MSKLQLSDIQGILLHGYGSLAAASFLLLRINDPAATKSWLQSLAIRNCEIRPESRDTCVNIAFTRAGLDRLGMPEDAMAMFAGEFRQGMTGTEHRQRILGDVDVSHPDQWQWGGPNTPEPHILLMLYAGDNDALRTLLTEYQTRFAQAGLELMTQLGTNLLNGRKEHFGFRDGIAQPAIEGFHNNSDYANTIAAGEFVLGYHNAYGQLTDRPLLPPDRDPEDVLPVVEGDASQKDFGKNGSYLVFRQLGQDVSGFWQYLEAQTRQTDGKPNPQARLKLAAKMVGRWPSGCPLVHSPQVDDPTRQDDNDFLYHGSGDAQGFKCPIGAHIRRSNPRDALEPQPGSQRSIEVGKRHRILRRGRAYGEPIAESMEPADILAADETDGERGLHFICFNTHIGRQFEFIQHTWVNNAKFDGLYEDDDPLIGHRGGNNGQPGGSFTVQAEPVRQRVTGMPRFVTVHGGGYFFMPGLRAVRYLSTLP